MFNKLQQLLPILITFLLTTNAQITPIINSTGEYFIANTSNSFQNLNVTCNSSILNCYIICPVADLCKRANIECASENCHIQCSDTSCQDININTSNSLQTSIHCKDANTCAAMQFTMYSPGNKQLQAGPSVNMVCDGLTSCYNSIIQTKQVSISVDCVGDKSCANINLFSDQNSQLHLSCYKNSSESSANCAGSTLHISGNTHHTQLLCNGGLHSASCNDMQILIPQKYQDGLLDIYYVDNNGSNITAMVGSADYLKINCIDAKGSIADCTEDKYINTTYPILGIATPTKPNTYSNTAAYSYRYQSIICNPANSSDSCEIQCISSQSCNYMYVNSTSNTQLICNDTSVTTNDPSTCYNVVIEATGNNNMNITCNGDHSCTTLSVLQGSTSTVNINCTSTGTSTCYDLNITTDNKISLTCSNGTSCESINLFSGTKGPTNLNCLGTGSCKSNIVINAKNGAEIQCPASYSCEELNVTVSGGDFKAMCTNDNSCAGSTFNVTGTTSSNNSLECTAVNSCQQVIFDTTAKDITLHCSGCYNITVTTYNPHSNLTIKCDKPNACNPMNVLTDGSVSMNCSTNSSCYAASISNRTEQTVNIGNSSIDCLGGNACKDLVFVTSTDIVATCNGSTSCAASNIQSLTGKVNMTCSDQDSCGQSVVNGYSDVELHCMGNKACAASFITTATDANIQCNGAYSCNGIAIKSNAATLRCVDNYACTGANVTGHGALSLDCGLGNHACSTMYISMNAGKVTNVPTKLICGEKGAYNACYNLVFKSYAETVNIECSGVGCYGANIVLYNPKSKLKMNCTGSNTCKIAKINTVGGLALNCIDDSSCISASIVSKSDVANSLNCNGELACSQMKFISTSDLSATCNGVSSCKTVNFTALETTLTCIGDQSCYSSNLTASGDLILDCSGMGNENCGGMVIKSGQHNGNAHLTNTFICSNKDASDPSGYSCSNNIIDTYAETINFNCSNMGGGACHSTWITANNVDSMISMNCNGTTACWQTSIDTNGAISVICNGTGACQSAFVRTLRQGVEAVVNCTGDKSCFNLKLKTADNVSVNCMGNKVCQELTINSDTSVNMTCAGFSACAQLTISGNDNLMLDCSGGIVNETNTQTCSGMTIDMALNVNNRTINTFLCGNDGAGSNINVSYACNGTVIRTYADNINFQCYEDGCNNLILNVSNPASKLDMLCVGNSSCSIMNILTNGAINITCNGSSSCKSSNVNPISSTPRITGDSFITCINKTSCDSLQVVSPTDISVTCDGYKACALLTVRSLSGTYGMNCNTNLTCYNANIALEARFNKGYSDLCEDTKIDTPQASSLQIYCDSRCKCKDLNVVATNVYSLNITAAGSDNLFNNSYINASHAHRIDINCKGLCSNNRIDANYSSTSVNILCDTRLFDGTKGYFGGCNGWTVNAANANQVTLDFKGKYAAPNGVFNVSNAKMVTVRYESDVGYVKNATNNRSLIIAPVASNLKLECYNYGCYFGKFKNKHGLSNINVTFGGTCNCTKIVNCVHEWKLTCDDGSNSFVGNKCNNGEACCEKAKVEIIEDTFKNYTKEAKCPAGSSSKKLSGGAIAGIVIGILALIIAIAFGVWYYKKKKREGLLVND